MHGRAAAAAKYPPGLCRTMFRALIKERRARTLGVRVVAEKVPKRWVGKVLDLEEHHEEGDIWWSGGLYKLGDQLATDDLAGMRFGGRESCGGKG